MHQVTALLLALLFLFFTGCEDKKPDQKSIPVENTTSVVIEKEEVESTTIVTVEEHEKKISDLFQFLDMQKEPYTVKVKEKGLRFQNHEKPIVLLQFFATWCAPCVGEIAYLNDLQEADKEDLFVAGILTRDTIDTDSLNAFIEEHEISYKILQQENDNDLAVHTAKELGIPGIFPIPLIVLYLNGEYYTHYEGSIPVEMVKHDIRQAKQQLKKN